MRDRRPITIGRLIAAPRGLVFAAWTVPDQIAAWFPDADHRAPTPPPRVEVDLRRGRPWSVSYGGAVSWIESFEYREVRAPEQLAFVPTVSDSGRVAAESSRVMTVTLRDTGDGGTHLTLRCSGAEDTVAELANRWSSRLARLADHFGQRRTHSDIADVTHSEE